MMFKIFTFLMYVTADDKKFEFILFMLCSFECYWTGPLYCLVFFQLF